MSDDPNRRSFLRWCIHGMGAVFAAIIGIPAVMYLIDPRNRAAAAGALRPVQGIKLGELGDIPQQGTIRDVRRDAWTLHPNDVIGRVWVVRTRDGTTKDCYDVWTTVCPHLGCSINANANPTSGFTCPCHNAQFNADGTKVVRPNYENVAPRGMDTLDFEVAADPENPDPNNRDLLLVKYQDFVASIPQKIPVE